MTDSWDRYDCKFMTSEIVFRLFENEFCLDFAEILNRSKEDSNLRWLCEVENDFQNKLNNLLNKSIPSKMAVYFNFVNYWPCKTAK